MGVPVHAVSAVTGDGLDELDPYLQPGKTIALLGSSGVGKSTLVNRFAGRDLLADVADERRRTRTPHDLTPRARAPAVGRGAPRHARDARAAALGRGGDPRHDVLRDQRARGEVQVRRLRARAGAGLCDPASAEPTARSPGSVGTVTASSSARCARWRSGRTRAFAPRRGSNEPASREAGARRSTSRKALASRYCEGLLGHLEDCAAPERLVLNRKRCLRPRETQGGRCVYRQSRRPGTKGGRRGARCPRGSHGHGRRVEGFSGRSRPGPGEKRHDADGLAFLGRPDQGEDRPAGESGGESESWT